MKKIYQIIALLMCCVCWACSDDTNEDLNNSRISLYKFRSVTEQSTNKLKKGVKALNMALTNEDGDKLLLTIGCSEWILKPTSYSLVDQVTVDKQFSAVLTSNGSLVNFANGTLDVSLIKDTYYIIGVFYTDFEKKVRCEFRGPISFVIGEDEPEPSGYTTTMKVSPIYIRDQNGQVTGVVDGVAQYSFAISDPSGNAVGQFDLINTAGLSSADELAGSYTAVNGAQAVGTMNAGNAFPMAWGGSSWGSFFIPEGGAKNFIQGGTVTLTTAVSSEGETLLTFSGSGLNTTLGMDENSTQQAGTANAVNYRFVSFLQGTGMELYEQNMHSEVLNRDIKYTVYLPAGYDGSKEYPVLYLLNGAMGSNNDWLAQGMVNPYASHYAATGGKEMIIACPNGCPDGIDAFYINNYQGSGLDYETYFIQEFVPFIESTFNIKAERGSRAIGGISMGGFGSLYYGLKYPDMFCYIYACSPGVYIPNTPSLDEYFQNENLPGITIEIGTEDFLFQAADAFEKALTGAGVKHEYITRNGAHDWTFWKACTPKIIEKVGAAFE